MLPVSWETWPAEQTRNITHAYLMLSSMVFRYTYKDEGTGVESVGRVSKVQESILVIVFLPG